MADDAFRRDADNLHVGVNHLSGPEVLETIRSIYEIPGATIDRARPMFGVGEK